VSFVTPNPCTSGGGSGGCCHLDCLTDSVTVCQGTTPWIVHLDEPIAVSGTFVQAPRDCSTDSITICPGDDPIVVVLDGGTIGVTGNNFDIRPLTCAEDSVTICPGDEPIVVILDGGTVGVTGNNFDIRPLTCAEDSVTICPGAEPIVVVLDGGTVGVTGNNFDIRPLTCAEDSVTICPGEEPIIVHLDECVCITGGVTINNVPNEPVIVHLDDCVCVTGTVTSTAQPATWTMNATSAGNTAVVITRPAEVGLRHYITAILLGYDVSPTTGKTYTLASGGTLIDQFVDENFDYMFTFPIQCPVNTSVVLTLGPGGINVIGKITLIGYTGV